MNTINANAQHPNEPIKYYLGLDVHKKNWSVTIRAGGMELKTWSMNPSASELANSLRKHYPGGQYYSAYEAGFCGFTAHRELGAHGIVNLVVHAADVPTTHKEKVTKRDQVDSRKLARHLENGDLTSVHIPEMAHQEFRALCRLRRKCTQQMVRLKCRIKSHLYYFGIALSEAETERHWSAAYIRGLEAQCASACAGAVSLDFLLVELNAQRQHQVAIMRRLRDVAKTGPAAATIRWLQTIPGIGFLTAITLISEIWDINRFKTFDHLCGFLGLVPATNSSGEHEQVTGMTPRKNKYLKHVIIEAAWVAVRKEVTLLKTFMRLQTRMRKTDAIVRIARKLLNRVRYVWIHQTAYTVAA